VGTDGIAPPYSVLMPLQKKGTSTYSPVPIPFSIVPLFFRALYTTLHHVTCGGVPAMPNFLSSHGRFWLQRCTFNDSHLVGTFPCPYLFGLTIGLPTRAYSYFIRSSVKTYELLYSHGRSFSIPSWRYIFHYSTSRCPF